MEKITSPTKLKAFLLDSVNRAKEGEINVEQARSIKKLCDQACENILLEAATLRLALLPTGIKNEKQVN